MESQQWPVVCMDFGRPEMMIVPILAFFSCLVKGLSGMGEALVYGAGWQLFRLAGYEEMDNLGLLAGLICVMQCTSTAQLAFKNYQQWWFYVKPGMVFSVAMLMLSPLGNHLREVAPTEDVQLVLSMTFLTFALLKPLSDGLFNITTAKQVEKRKNLEGDNITEPREPMECTEVTESEKHEELEQQDPEEDHEEQHEENKDQSTTVKDQLPEPPWWLMGALPPVGLIGGFLGGLCGMNGPPFILLTAITGLDKVVARNLFPMGQAIEVWTFRFPMLLSLRRIRLEDAHIYCVGLFAGAVGLQMGNLVAPKVSQKLFERSMLLFLVLSSLLVLGLLQGHPRALVALGVVLLVALIRLLTGRRVRAVQRLQKPPSTAT
ncbi:unnamed protein product [Durusdinium trenchii]|uniref:Uncharacterized protein n=1 Tax=Durusdinium trenchii TaxID=1381693 RepID=A0ABP0RZA7_9DINO